MNRQLGDNIYRADNPNFANSFLERYKTANMENQADFYGKQADDYGKKADASEEGAKSQGDAAKSIGSAMAGATNPGDMVSAGLMASGNPYAMAAGGVLKVASMGQQREQQNLNASRAAFIDRQNRMRDISDKIMSTNFGV